MDGRSIRYDWSKSADQDRGQCRGKQQEEWISHVKDDNMC